MEQYYELISVPAIATIVYWTIYAIRCAVNSDKFNRFVPLISGLLGAVCGVVCFYAIPSIMPASNVWSALIIGAASGLTATGTHQIVKQLSAGSDAKADEKPAKDSPENSEQQSPSDETEKNSQEETK